MAACEASDRDNRRASALPVPESATAADAAHSEVLFEMKLLHIDATPIFKVGDPCPDGYIARQEWAQVHLDAGLKQEQCGYCLLWKFPHELHHKPMHFMASRTKHGPKNVKI